MIYMELKGWQTAIGSLFGLFALALAALLNFHLNRKRDDRLRNDEARSVMAALYGEIILLRRDAASLARHAARVETLGVACVKIDNEFLDTHLLPEPLLYMALAPKLGLLSADLILAITEFHKNVADARLWLSVMVKFRDKSLYSISTILEPARDAVIKIGPALAKIEVILAIENKTSEPDLGDAEMVIDVIHEMELEQSS